MNIADTLKSFGNEKQQVLDNLTCMGCDVESYRRRGCLVSLLNLLQCDVLAAWYLGVTVYVDSLERYVTASWSNESRKRVGWILNQQ